MRGLAIAQLLMNTGVRVQELCSLEWQDILGGLTIIGTKKYAKGP